MRCREMDIFNVIFCITVPALLRHLNILFLCSHRFRCNQPAVTSVQGQTLDFIRVRLIQQTELFGELLTGDIKLLDDIVIRRIGNLSDV